MGALALSSFLLGSRSCRNKHGCKLSAVIQSHLWHCGDEGMMEERIQRRKGIPSPPYPPFLLLESCALILHYRGL